MTRISSFILGGLAGGAVATLFAPRPGRETRRRIREALQDAIAAEPEPPHQSSPTALAAEALRTGVAPYPYPNTHRHREEMPEIPNEDERLQMGDPEVDPLRAAYVGDEVAGGDMSTPDQDGVDDIGRAYGVKEEDSGALRPSAEILTRRDRKRRSKSAGTETARRRTSEV